MGKKKNEDPAALDAELDAAVNKDIEDLTRQAEEAFGDDPDLAPSRVELPPDQTPPETPNALAEAFPNPDRQKVLLMTNHLREVELRARSGADIDVLRFVRQLISIAEG